MTGFTTGTTAPAGEQAAVADMEITPQLDTILLKTASRCNIDCSYCYVYRGPDASWRDQPKRMEPETLAMVIERLIEQAELQDAGFAIVLHGGEPLLLGFDRLNDLLSGVRTALPVDRYPISIQTNGTLLNSDLLELLAETETSVSVSIDGPSLANDIDRLDHRRRSTFASTMRGIRLLASHRDRAFLFAGTLSVIQPSIDPNVIYGFLKDLGTPSMDFLLQDGNHDRLPAWKSRFESTEYGRWLAKIVDLYLADPSPVPVRIVDDTIKLCLGGSSQREGSGERPFGILIVESNGEIRKNDTLKASFEGADRFVGPWNVKATPLATVLSSDEFTSYAAMQLPTATRCKECRLLEICGGGMPLYRWSATRGYDNPSVYCRDHEYFIDHVLARLTRLGLGRSITKHAPGHLRLTPA